MSKSNGLGRISTKHLASIWLTFVVVTSALVGNTQESAHEVLSGEIAPEVFAASDALGLVRGVGNANLAAVNFESYEGSGVLHINGTDIPLPHFRWEYDYTVPALRMELSLEGENPFGTDHRIEVIRGDQLWLESKPGFIESISDDEQRATYLQTYIYSTPTGAVRAAVEAELHGQGVEVQSRNGKTVLVFSHNGIDFQVTLNSENRPESVEMANADGTYAAHFSGYKDHEGYFVYHPSKFERVNNGDVVMELEFKSVRMNPYIIFPTPEQLGYQQQASQE